MTALFSKSLSKSGSSGDESSSERAGDKCLFPSNESAGALPTFCHCDVLVNLCCESVVMTFYFGLAARCFLSLLCVIFLLLRKI